MNNIHIHRGNSQDNATKYICDAGIEITFKNKDALFTQCCQVRQYAEDLKVQVLYDGDRFFCKEGRGCKR